jgi:hypothetical protein
MAAVSFMIQTPGTNPREEQLNSSSLALAVDLPTNRLLWKGLQATNYLAYNKHFSIIVVKCFDNIVPVGGSINLLTYMQSVVSLIIPRNYKHIQK